MHRSPALAASALTLLLIAAPPARAQEIRHEPLVLAQGGTPEQPAVFDGKGMIIDLGIDITAHDWIKTGDLWTSNGPLPGLPPIEDTQRAGLFIDEVPVRIMRDRAAEQKSGEPRKVIYVAPSALKPGEMAWTADGCACFRWPVGKSPGSATIFQPPPKLASCVSIQCNYLTVRNIIARHAANDGFNIHGDRLGIRLENVKALSNGDEGISAHEAAQIDVVNAEIAWNGSSAGGVADVGDSVTTYTKCEVHHNVGAAFFFDGRVHRVTDCLIHHQSQDILVRGDAKVEQSGNVWRKE